MGSPANSISVARGDLHSWLITQTKTSWLFEDDLQKTTHRCTINVINMLVTLFKVKFSKGKAKTYTWPPKTELLK